jgi:hypothetical protein
MKPLRRGYKKLAVDGDWRSSSRWFAALDHVERFLLLDAYQLIKHYLGLCETFKHEQPELTLVYLYWEPANTSDIILAELFERHRREVAEFVDLVAGDPSCRFVPLSYPEYWAELEKVSDQPDWFAEHLRLLRARYLVKL